MIALGIVALLHVGLGYAFVTGLALKAVKVLVDPLEAIDIKEEAPPPDEPPPPPPKEVEIPPYVPPPEVTIQSDAPPPPTITTQAYVPQPAPVVIAPPAPTAITPPAPPAPKPGTVARVRGNRLKLFSTDDYPSSSLRREEEGRVVARFDINEKGRVENCVVTQSVTPDLDRVTCRLFEARLKFEPATENGVPVRQTAYTDGITWKIPPK